MATQIGGEVFQDSLRALSDGNTPPFPLLRMGVPPVANKWDLLALQGRMFNLQETTTGTAIAAAAFDASSNVLTIPTLRLTVPTGTTIFPYRFNIAYEVRAGTITELMVIASETDTFTSSNTLLTPVNWRTDNPRASACTNVGTGTCVEAALVRPRSLYKSVRTHAVAAVEQNCEEKVWRTFWPLVGPASLIIYAGSAGAAATFIFSLDWAEVPTSSAISAV